MNTHIDTPMDIVLQKCEHCDVEFESEEQKKMHNDEKHPTPSAPPLPDDSDYTCEECDYQTSQFQQLLEHIETKHKVATVPVEDKDADLLKCKDCTNKFPNYDSMMKHRKQKHPKNCRNFPKGTCHHGDRCYWVHPQANSQTMEVNDSTESAPNESNFKCHTCGEVFTSKNSMMKHKKSKHAQTIKCRDFPNCRRSAEQCWYRHDSVEQICSHATAPSAPAGGAPSACTPPVNAPRGQDSTIQIQN